MGCEAVASRAAHALRALARALPAIPVVGPVVIGIYLLSLAGSWYWASNSQRESAEQGRIEQVTALGTTLARAAEVLVADNDLSAVRRILMETAQDCSLERCRIVLPNGGTVADASPAGIDQVELPRKWEGASGQLIPVAIRDGRITAAFPLVVVGRGSATLEIVAAVSPSAGVGPPAIGGAVRGRGAPIGIILVGGLAALVLLFSWDRRCSRSTRAVSLALREFAASRGIPAATRGPQPQNTAAGNPSCGVGLASPSLLAVNTEWGPEAQAWNSLLDELEQQRRQVALDKTRQVLELRRTSGGDLDAACDAMSQGLILVGEDLRVKYANGAAAVLLKARREEILGSNIETVIPDRRVAEAIDSTVRGNMPRRTIVESDRDEVPGGGVLRFIVRQVRREDSGVAMIVIEDITQQRLAERARNAFVAQATHELRAPLTNIRLYVEMAMDQGASDPATLAQSLNTVNQEVRRLERMVSDILSVSEMEAGVMKLRKDDVRLDELFRDLQADYAAQAGEKQVELVFNLPPKLPVIQADRDKVILGFQNLVSNAVKYTPPGGRVTVNVTVRDGQMITDVTDTGIGISSEDCRRIFEKFYRAKDKRVGDVTGSGLGLAIAREIVRLHGGDITVHSELDKGSTFTLALPVQGTSPQ